VLRQIPTAPDLAGIGLVVAGVAVHQDRPGPAAAAPAQPDRRPRSTNRISQS
jgi:hypothetical protein